MRRSRRWWCGPAATVSLGLLTAGCSGHGPDEGVTSLPPARTTLAAVAQRLGRARSPGHLTAIARRSSRVLAELTARERAALGRSSIRFRVGEPVVVEVAAAERDEPPFWLADQRFRATGRVIHDADGAGFRLFARRFEAGPIGLGVNALDRSSDAHYAVFVRPARATSGRVAIEGIGPERVLARAAGRTASPFEDVDRPFVDLPPDLEAGSTIATRQADRADGALLPFGRAWKTRQPSGPRPDQVVASFGIDPTRTLAISWRTDPSVAGSAARLVPAADLEAGRDAVAYRGDSHPIRSDGLLNDPTILRHQVTATGLRPGTRYAYAVGDGTRAGWSPWYSVRTAPEAPGDFGFLYLGDAQCELERWGELASVAVRARPDAGFLLLAGDLVDRGNERSNWDHFFLRGRGVFDAIPFMPAVGNHEYLDKGPAIYRDTFDLPKNGPPGIAPNLVYSFEYADAFVAVLDSNLALHDPEAAAAEAAWLDRALAATRKAWKFVAFHHPIYASHPSRSNPQLGRAWIPIFDKHHVDLVLTGHDHAYLRSKPMRGGVPVADPAEGTVYVVSVSGEKFYGQEPHDFTAVGLTHVATYQTIDVDAAGRRLRYRSFDRAARQVDALTIEKSAEATAVGAELAGGIGR